jgi:hypothetical protein
VNAAKRDLWRQRHRFCTDTPPPFESLDHARAVLDDHGAHDEKCLQLIAALDCVSAVR